MSEIESTLAKLVVKDGVSLGGLPLAEQALALAVVHATLPAHTVLDERSINLALKAALAGPACWLHTDHVELRRWLVDAGWLQRDGFGREYRAVAHAALRAEQQPLAHSLARLGELNRWVAAQRDSRAALRAERHARWLAAQQGSQAAGVR